MESVSNLERIGFFGKKTWQRISKLLLCSLKVPHIEGRGKEGVNWCACSCAKKTASFMLSLPK